MDNKKIGKLIAELRKQKGLTQQDLGDKVGVGFRAVSKWERGLTSPDIAIINELSKILGISSDELLAGKLNKKHKQKDKKKFPMYLKIIIPIIIIIIIAISLIIYNNNKTYAYKLKSVNDEYYVEGQLVLKDDKLSIVVNKIKFNDADFASTIIKNYEYRIYIGDTFIFGYGDDVTIDYIEARDSSIKKLSQSIDINYNGKTKLKIKEILKNNIMIIINFIDNSDNKITKEVEISLNELKKENAQ